MISPLLNEHILYKKEIEIMAKKYENYNSAYPLAYYEVGKVYAFYGTTGVCAEPATDSEVNSFAAALDEIEVDTGVKLDAIENASNVHRYYAVVVAKQDGSITVMFQNNNSDGTIGYLTKNYLVDAGCGTDGMELMPTSMATSYAVIGTKRPESTGIKHAPEGELTTGLKHDGEPSENNKVVSGLKHDGSK